MVELTKIRDKIYELSSEGICEEKTKIYLVMPFLKYIGYDVFSPNDIIPEYKPSHYTGNERVDFALCNDGVPQVYVEVKRHGVDLEKDIKWLAKYFNSDPYIKLGVLTNGEVYKFFTDTEYENIMDKEPFYEFSVRRYGRLDEFILGYFHKSIFTNNSIGYSIETIYNIGKLVEGYSVLCNNKEKYIELKDKSGIIDYIYDEYKIDDTYLARELSKSLIKES